MISSSLRRFAWSKAGRISGSQFRAWREWAREQKRNPMIRRYGISFLLLPFNIFSTYYFQAMMKPSTAFVAPVGRGAVISGILIYLETAAGEKVTVWKQNPKKG